MRKTKFMALCFIVASIFTLTACSGSSSNNENINNQDAFIAAYNAAAVEVGAQTFDEEDLKPYNENGEEMEGFIVNEGVLEASMLSFTPGQVMLVGRPSEFDNFYLETEAVMMALMGLDKETADEMVNDLFFKEDAAETTNAAGGTNASKTIQEGGISLSASQTNGIFMMNFSPK